MIISFLFRRGISHHRTCLDYYLFWKFNAPFVIMFFFKEGGVRGGGRREGLGCGFFFSFFFIFIFLDTFDRKRRQWTRRLSNIPAT